MWGSIFLLQKLDFLKVFWYSAGRIFTCRGDDGRRCHRSRGVSMIWPDTRVPLNGEIPINDPKIGRNIRDRPWHLLVRAFDEKRIEA